MGEVSYAVWSGGSGFRVDQFMYFGSVFYVLRFMALGLMVFRLSLSGCMVSGSFGEWFYSVCLGVMVLVLSA